MKRLRLDDLVDLGDGWYRAPRAGEELFEVAVLIPGCSWSQRRWIDERRLVELATEPAYAGLDLEVSTMVVPARRARGAGVDPRQLLLPLEVRP